MSKKQMMDESSAIDAEWSRINKERESFRIADAEMNKEVDDYNHEVSLVNRRGGSDADVRRLDERMLARKQREAVLEERKCRCLYDIEEVNRRSEAFNRKYQGDTEPKKVIGMEMTQNGRRLYPQPYRKGEPLHSVVSGGTSSSSSSSASVSSKPTSPSKVKTKSTSSPKAKDKRASSPGAQTGVQTRTTVVREWQPSEAVADAMGSKTTYFKTTSIKNPTGETTSPPKTKAKSTSSPKAKTKSVSPSKSAVQSRTVVVRGASNPADESRLLDQEWARIEREDRRFTSENRRLGDENSRLNERIREVNSMSNNKKLIAEVDALVKQLDQEYAALATEKRHLLYDIELYNQRILAFNNVVRGTDIPQKHTQGFTYSQDNVKLTPLAY